MTTTKQWFERHAADLQDALAHWKARDFYGSPYAEIPSEKIFGEGAAAKGRERFEALLQNAFDLPGHPQAGEVGSEQSPYSLDLGIRYPHNDAGALVNLCQRAMRPWRDADIDARAGVLTETLQRLARDSFCMANAVMHTSGQGFMMAFQAGASHALQRALESVAAGYGQLRDIPAEAVWEKPQGKKPPLRLQKRFRAMPRGVAAVIGCSTFPTWNSYPAIFANLMCGNGVIVKPHPGAVLPLALTVRALRETLAEAGMDANLVLLAADDEKKPLAKDLAGQSAVKLIDYTGNTKFGDWLEASATSGRRVFAEKAGVNCVVIDDIAETEKAAANLALSLSLYSGQMCTTPQNLFITKTKHDDFLAALEAGFERWLGDDAQASEILGAIQSSATMERRNEAAKKAKALIDRAPPKHPAYPKARIASPLLLQGDAAGDLHRREWFGPVSFLIPVDDKHAALQEMRRCFADFGALTAGVYSDDEDFLAEAENACAETGAHVALNLRGAALINHSAAFSDPHGSGANPAANACITDAAFVASRYYIAQARRLAT